MSHDVIGADTAKSTTTPLSAGATYTSDPFALMGYSTVTIEFASDQPGAAFPNDLQIRQSQDPGYANWDIVDRWTIGPEKWDPVANLYRFEITVAARGIWGRLVYTTAGAQTVFRLQAMRKALQPVLPNALTADGNLKIAIQEAPVVPTKQVDSTGAALVSAERDDLRRVERLLGYLVRYAAEQNNDLAGIIEAEEAISMGVGST